MGERGVVINQALKQSSDQAVQAVTGARGVSSSRLAFNALRLVQFD